MTLHLSLKLSSILLLFFNSNSFVIHPSRTTPFHLSTQQHHYSNYVTQLKLSIPSPSNINLNQDDDDDIDEDEDDDDEEEDDPYTTFASSEFQSTGKETGSNGSREGNETLTSNLDWGGALSSLRQRVSDVETGKSQDPSQVLFRIMTSSGPTDTIRNFVNEANPEIVQAMSGTVSGMLGGLSNPISGIDTIVTANSDKLGALCFQLQMTGYMFRNAEYVVALKQLMKIKSKGGATTLPEYKEAFDRLDIDDSGYIEFSEVETLLSDVYNGPVPKFEVQAFMKHFDTNSDGRISWKEFEQGLGAMKADQVAKEVARQYSFPLLNAEKDDDEDEDDDEYPDTLDEPTISGTIEIEIGNGKYIQVEANDYISDLKKEAQELKEALLREKGGSASSKSSTEGLSASEILGAGRIPDEDAGSITSYLVTLGSDISTLTKGISPEVVDTMKLLVDFVLNNNESPSSSKGSSGRQALKRNEPKELEIPGSALQQLAFWQLVLGYKLREAEATDDYRQMLK